MHTLLITFFVLAVVFNISTWASDTEREKQIASSITDFLVVGEELWLQGLNEKFLALYTASEQSPAEGCVLLLHGRGAHPAWVDVIEPLRIGLPESGWSTLSIQLPVAEHDAEFSRYIEIFPQAAPRIDTAIITMRALECEGIVVIGHSLGALMGAAYISHTTAIDIMGFAGIGLPTSSFNAEIDTARFIKNISLPILDLYGDDDLPNVKTTAWVRAAAAEHNSDYLQTMVPDANHFFHNQSDQLLNLISDWLGTLSH